MGEQGFDWRQPLSEEEVTAMDAERDPKYTRLVRNIEEAQRLLSADIQEYHDLSDVLNYLTPDAQDAMLADLRAELAAATPENRAAVEKTWVEDALEAASRTTGPGGTAGHGRLNERVRKWLEVNKGAGGNVRGLTEAETE